MKRFWSLGFVAASMIASGIVVAQVKPAEAMTCVPGPQNPNGSKQPGLGICVRYPPLRMGALLPGQGCTKSEVLVPVRKGVKVVSYVCVTAITMNTARPR